MRFSTILILMLTFYSSQVFSQSGQFDKLNIIHGWYHAQGNSPETYFSRNEQYGNYPILRLNLGNSTNTLFDIGYTNTQWNSVFRIGAGGFVGMTGRLSIGETSKNLSSKGVVLGIGHESIELMTSGYLNGSSVKVNGYDPADGTGKVGLSFEVKDYSGSNYGNRETPALFITSGHSDKGKIGNIGIGTSNPDSKLTVAGNIHSREVKVTVDAGADFVFDEAYQLRTLEETEEFIKENNHLPEIASEEEMLGNGLQVGEMNIKLLQKIEELTLYLIEQNKQNKEQQERIERLERVNSELLKKLENQ